MQGSSIAMNDPLYRARIVTLWVLCALNAAMVYCIGRLIFS